MPDVLPLLRPLRSVAQWPVLHIKFTSRFNAVSNTQGFCVADFATLSDVRRSRSKIVLLIRIKEPCVLKFEVLTRSKILGILQAEWLGYLESALVGKSLFILKHRSWQSDRSTDLEIKLCTPITWKSIKQPHKLTQRGYLGTKFPSLAVN